MDVEFHNKDNMSNEYSGNLQLYWDLHIQLLIYVTICFFHLLIVWKLHIATATTIVMWRIFQFTTTFSFFNQLKNCKFYYNRNSLVILKKWKKFLIFDTEYLSELLCCGIAKTSYNRYSISYPEPDSTYRDTWSPTHAIIPSHHHDVSVDDRPPHLRILRTQPQYSFRLSWNGVDGRSTTTQGISDIYILVPKRTDESLSHRRRNKHTSSSFIDLDLSTLPRLLHHLSLSSLPSAPRALPLSCFACSVPNPIMNPFSFLL